MERCVVFWGGFTTSCSPSAAHGLVAAKQAEMKQSEQQAAIKATTAKLFKLRLSIIKVRAVA